MSFFILLSIAVGLSMDAFAVATACSVSLRRVTRRQIFRFAFHFGLFQAMMPVIGWMAGVTIRQYIGSFDLWVAFGLLVFVGGNMIREAIWGDEDEENEKDPTKGISLVTLSFATSIDALAVGISLAMQGVKIWYPAVTIGVVTAFLTALGMLIGSRLGERFGKRLEILGGIILIGIGLKILLSSAIM